MFKKNKVINPITNKKPDPFTPKEVVEHLIRGGSWGTNKTKSSYRGIVFCDAYSRCVGYKICLKRIK
jgi:hypothetical protein